MAHKINGVEDGKMHITAEEIYKLRKVSRLTQAEIGTICGVSDAYVNQIERGKRSVSERMRRSIIQGLDLTPQKLERLLSIYDETKISKEELK